MHSCSFCTTKKARDWNFKYYALYGYGMGRAKMRCIVNVIIFFPLDVFFIAFSIRFEDCLLVWNPW